MWSFKAVAKKAKTKTGLSDLQAAIKFCSVATRDIGQPYQSHFIINKGWLASFDGVIATAHPIKTSDYMCCPNAEMFRAAIAKASGDLAMTITPDADKLIIVTGKLRANIPCIYPNDFPFYPPDPPLGKVDNRLRAAIMTCGALISENAQLMHETAMLLRSNTCVSTDGKSLFESWHGLHVPTLILPKALATALEKTQDKNLASFGFSDQSITIYFEDGAWIKSQLYAGAVTDYPRIEAVLDLYPPMNMLVPVPPDFSDAVGTIATFADVVMIALEPDKIETPNGDAAYEIDLSAGLPSAMNCSPKRLGQVKWATHWLARDSKFFFAGKVYGEPCRAIIMGMMNSPKIEKDDPRIDRDTGF